MRSRDHSNEANKRKTEFKTEKRISTFTWNTFEEEESWGRVSSWKVFWQKVGKKKNLIDN